MRATSFDLDYEMTSYAGPRHARRTGERAALGMGVAASFFLLVAALINGVAPAPGDQKLAVSVAPRTAAPAQMSQVTQVAQAPRAAKFTTKASMAQPDLSAGALVKSYAGFDLVAPGFEQEKKTVSSRDTGDENGRIDTLTMGDFGRGGPFLRIDIHRGLGPVEASPDFFLDMTRQANRQFLSVNKISHPAPLNTKFGAFEAAEMRMSAADGAPGADPRACMGARLVDKANALEITGLFCGATAAAPLARATFGCLLDGVDYMPAGAEGDVSAFFEKARSTQGASCANIAQDDVTASIPTRKTRGKKGKPGRAE